jgi:hypothetical protein
LISLARRRSSRTSAVAGLARIATGAALLLTALLAGGCSHLVERSNAGIAFLEDSRVGPVARGAKYAGWALSAPLLVAVAPITGLAWLTPWVDLPVAVDLNSAPAIGLGYALQAIVGGSAYVVAGAWREEGGWAEPPRWVPWGFVLEHRPAAASPRPARPVPAAIDAYYAVDEAQIERLRAEFVKAVRSAASPGDAPPTAVRVPLAGGQPSTIELSLAHGGPRPLVLMTPPSKAAFAARYLARWLVRRGIHAAVIVPEGSFLPPDMTPAEVEASFRQAAVNARLTLRALARLDVVDPERLDYLGVSAGAIFGAALLAVEPTIRRAALILPGGDVARIIGESDESTTRAYRKAWARRGVGRDALVERLRHEIRSDPAHLAAFIHPRRVLMFVGARDTQVPTETGLELWRALGEPELYILSGNHETASLCFGFVLRRSERFLREGR